MQPLLAAKSTETASKQIIFEQVVTSEISIQISFSGERGMKGDLKVKEGLKAIVVKAAYVKGSVVIR